MVHAPQDLCPKSNALVSAAAVLRLRFGQRGSSTLCGPCCRLCQLAMSRSKVQCATPKALFCMACFQQGARNSGRFCVTVHLLQQDSDIGKLLHQNESRLTESCALIHAGQGLPEIQAQQTALECLMGFPRCRNRGRSFRASSGQEQFR